MRTLFVLPFLFSTLTFAEGLTAQPAPPSPRTMQCLFRLQEKLDGVTARLNSEYLSIDPEQGAIPASKNSYGIPPANSAHEDEGVLVIHGFSASPSETHSVGVAVSAAGYPVIMALLPGFGSSTRVANTYSPEDWRKAVAEYADLMSLCFKKVHLVGFSLGGGLVSDFLLTHPGMSPEGVFQSSRGPVQVLSASLLSPYFATGSGITDWLAAKLHEKLGIEGIEIQALYSVLSWLNLRTTVNDLKALALYPSRFNKDLPLGAAVQVAKFGEELRGRAAGRHTGVRGFLAYSEVDHTIDREQAAAFVREHFTGFRAESDELVYPAQKNVPHQITLAAWNPELAALLDRIVKRMETAAQ